MLDERILKHAKSLQLILTNWFNEEWKQYYGLALKWGCILTTTNSLYREEEGPNTGGRSASNGATTTNHEEGRNHDDDMKWRRESLKWRETWETRRLEGAHKEGLGFGWIIMRCSFSKEDPMQQLHIPKLHLALPLHSERRYHYQTIRWTTTTQLTNSLMLPLYLAEVGHLKNGGK